MASSSPSVIEQYETEIGYKPETLEKLWNFVKSKGISTEYGQVKQAFEKMKQDIRSTAIDRDLVKSEITNTDVNTAKIEVKLSANPDSQQPQTMQADEHKTWTFDISKATEALSTFERLNKKMTINAETLPQILEWANNEENKMGITLSELKQAYTQKKQFEAMDFPGNSKTKRKTKKKKKKAAETTVDAQSTNIDDDVKLDLIELKSMTEFCEDNEVMKEVLTLYYAQWKHDPENAKQLVNFVEEQALNDKDEKFKELNFEVVSAFFKQYSEYKSDVEMKNVKIESQRKAQAEKKNLGDFNCRDILNKYVEEHGEPKDSTMFYKHVLGLGYDLEFATVDEEYNKAKGIKKAKPKKVKVKNTSKSVLNKYKKAKASNK